MNLTEAFIGWLLINLVLLIAVLVFGPFIISRDERIGQGGGLNRFRNSVGNLPFQGIRLIFGIFLFVIPPAIVGAQEGGGSGAITGAVLGGSFLVWLACLKWWTSI